MPELRNFLIRHKLTQRDLADGIGVTTQFISLILAGESGPSLETAKKILAFCQAREPGLTFEMLFGVAA